MKTAWGIFVHDLRKLAGNRVALVVAIALVLLPAALACCPVAALWSPGEHTNGLKVALVNNDAGAPARSARVLDADALSEKLGGSDELNVGSLMIDAAQQDGRLNWQLVDANQAEAGLASGEYYAAFVLPETFTRDFLDVLSGDLDRPTVDYLVGGKFGMTAPQATGSGADVVSSTVSRTFSAMAADALSGIVNDVASGLLEAGNGKSATSTGLEGARRDLANVTANVKHASSSADRWRTTLTDAQSTLDNLKITAPALRDSIKDGRELLSEARASVHEVENAYSSVLSQGGNDLATALGKVSDQVTKTIGDIATKQGEVDAALEKAREASDGNARLIDALRRADPGSKALSDLEAQNNQLKDEIAALEKASGAVSDAAKKADEDTKSLSDDVKKSVDKIKDRNSKFNGEALPKIDTSLDAFASILGSLDGALASLDAQIDQAKTLLGQIDGVLKATEESLGTALSSLDDAMTSIDSARSDLAALASSRSTEKASGASGAGVKVRESFLASPVNAEVKSVYPIASYGAGVAPFCMSLALWVGCLMLIAVLKLEADPAPFSEAQPWQVRAGRLLLFGAFALAQALIVALGALVLGVSAAFPPALILASLFAAFCFAGVVYALVTTFDHLGAALAVVLLIIQVPGAVSVRPAQLMPDFLQALYSCLPLAYSSGAMREAIGGFYGTTFLQCLAWLLACGVAAIAVAWLVRPRMQGLSGLFARKLGAADVFAATAAPGGDDGLRAPEAGVGRRATGPLDALDAEGEGGDA